jgi:hypothetical protein
VFVPAHPNLQLQVYNKLAEVKSISDESQQKGPFSCLRKGVTPGEQSAFRCFFDFSTG